MKMIRVGIFFGGQSREREVSFAGGRTVYDNLDKNLFTPVPIFVDSLGRFVLLNWQHLYKGSIRDFYPPAQYYPQGSESFQLYIESLLAFLNEEELSSLVKEVGELIYPHQFKSYFDVAFLALHGPYGEDGNIQGLLEWHQIPYTGCGILASTLGVSKIAQRKLMKAAGFNTPASLVMDKKTLISQTVESFERVKAELGLPFVVKSPNQGSSLGVSILKNDSLKEFEEAVLKSLFINRLKKSDWHSWNRYKKEDYARILGDIREGIGYPVCVNGNYIYHPQELITFLNNELEYQDWLDIEALNGETEVLFEAFVKGREFSCIVLEDLEGNPVALPPTEIVKSQLLFDYRSKYLPGLSRKVTPIDTSDENLETICRESENLFQLLQCSVYARIDGFLTETGQVFLNDPNTTSGMMPSSFFFHQAAEIGLNPSEFLTYIVYISLVSRSKTGKLQFESLKWLHVLEDSLQKKHQQSENREKVGVILGGYSSERHISVESGRNIYEKLSSSTQYRPIPIFLTGNSSHFELYKIPVNILLKDNADDIAQKVKHPSERHPILNHIARKCLNITHKFSSQTNFESELWDFERLASETSLVFIALHGRPGEDGALQRELEKWGIAYNGSGVESSSTTIDKYLTNEILMRHQVEVAKHALVEKHDWLEAPDALIEKIESSFRYPFIAKPADDGCSSAVKKIKNRDQFVAYTNSLFRNEESVNSDDEALLGLKPGEEFPIKTKFVVEELIQRNGAAHFLEITGGMLSHRKEDGSIELEVFEPSETLASGEVLSLEEKFLAGEGQNITPARFSKDPEEQRRISTLVKNELERTARALHVEGYCRIDAFVRIHPNGNVDTIIIEINSLPGMTPATCIYHQCALNGYKPYDFIHSILSFGKSKKLWASISN